MSTLATQGLLWQGAMSVLAAALVWLASTALHRTLRWSADATGFWWGVLALMIVPLPLAHLVPARVATHIESLQVLNIVPDEEGLGMALSSVSGAGSAIDVPALLMLAYMTGLAVLLARTWRGHRRLRRLLANLDAIDAHALPGPRSNRLARALQRRGVHLRTIPSSVTPFALARPARLIVLPTPLLGQLDDLQCWQLLRHEAMHLQRRDHLRMRLLAALCALHWFNPFVWAAAQRLRLATELRCDRPALRHKHMRRAYAEAYLQALRMSAARALPCATAAFSAHDQGHHKMRIAHILSGRPGPRKSPLRRSIAAALGLAATVALTASQAASLGRIEVESAIASPQAAQQTSGSGAAPAFRGPIVAGRVSSGFGVLRPAVTARPHRGIDLVAAHGTPVYSPAAGTVLTAEAPYARAPKYGTVVVIDHGDGWQSLYAHLDTFAVSPGDVVRAGDRLGTLGSTGLATGPHVHVEVHHQGRRVDPAEVIEQIVGPG